MGGSHFPHAAGHFSSDGTKDITGFLGCKVHIAGSHTLAFLIPSSACPDSISAFLPGDTSLLPLSVLALFSPLFDLQVLAKPYQFPASACFLILRAGELLHSQKGNLKE